jgi:O-succinylbenzoic acid--CoA ligase
VESPLSIWERRRDEPWVVGFDAGLLRKLVEEQQAELSSSDHTGVVGISTDDPLRFTVEFLAALTHEVAHQIFLGPVPAGATPNGETRIMVATGGTTGKPRYAVHTWDSLVAAVRGLQRWMGGVPIVSVCFLPMRHTSGFMQLIRCFVTDGRILFNSGQSLELGNVPVVPEGAVTSLVPTQLARLLDVPRAVEWLGFFRIVFVGGGPVWPDLLKRARAAKIPVALCYGMTETAAQIATQSPQDFLAGTEPCVEILPHASVRIVDANGEVLPVGKVGRIQIKSESLFHGYWPDGDRDADWFLSGDRGALDSKGRLHVLGRADAVIISGGKKVEPGEVEEAVRATGLVGDVAVVGAPDDEWGEIVVAVVVCDESSLSRLPHRLRESLDVYKIPKRWKRVELLPRDEVGKIDRRSLQTIASEP